MPMERRRADPFSSIPFARAEFFPKATLRPPWKRKTRAGAPCLSQQGVVWLELTGLSEAPEKLMDQPVPAQIRKVAINIIHQGTAVGETEANAGR